MKSLRIILAVAEWAFAASGLFATDYTWPTTNYAGLGSSTDYSWNDSDTPERNTATITEADLPPEAKPTPHREVHRILKWFNLTPESTLVEYGCGFDARFCVAASSIYGCKSIGIEIDPERAESARQRVAALGLSDKITIIEGDATTVDVQGDYGVAYLYPDVLGQLRQKIIELERFASYSHDVPGLKTDKSGQSYFWSRANYERELASESQGKQPTQAVGYWGGHAYSGRVCSNPGCQMCLSIQQQIQNTKRSQAALEKPVEVQRSQDEKKPGVNGNWFSIKYCNGRQCWYQTEWRWF
jgi:hypothetical protein